jgi:hypothetical protein
MAYEEFLGGVTLMAYVEAREDNNYYRPRRALQDRNQCPVF